MILIRLMSLWSEYGIDFGNGSSLNAIKEFERKKELVLPDQFVRYFLRIDGMKSLYPESFDKEGFLFYPLNAIVTFSEEFDTKEREDLKKSFVFAEYMHKSWWYGVQIDCGKEMYKIGIIREIGHFKPITNSLADFILLYLCNDTLLYNYE